MKKEIVSANIIELTLDHNGYQGGDSGHGGYVEIKIKDLSGTDMSINGKQVSEFTLRIQGDCERDTFTEAFRLIYEELSKENRNVFVEDIPCS